MNAESQIKNIFNIGWFDIFKKSDGKRLKNWYLLKNNIVLGFTGVYTSMGWWGITKKIIDSIKNQKLPFYIILFEEIQNETCFFLVSEKQFEEKIKNKIWRLDHNDRYSKYHIHHNESFDLKEISLKKIKQIIFKNSNNDFPDNYKHNKAKKTSVLLAKESLDEIISLTEGGKKVVVSEQTERNPKLRRNAIKIHGLICKVCGFDFNKLYGNWGKGFIEVHHIRPLGISKETRPTNPKKDLTVLCSNCHRMIHRKKRMTLTIEELQNKINK